MSTGRDTDRKQRLGLPAEVGCTGKVQFDTRSMAAQVADRGARNKQPGRMPYRCAHCCKWHLGRDIGRVKRRKAAEHRRAKESV